jgi:hypothetical protein
MDSNNAEILGSQKHQHHGQEHQQKRVKGTIPITFSSGCLKASPFFHTNCVWSGSYASTPSKLIPFFSFITISVSIRAELDGVLAAYEFLPS